MSNAAATLVGQNLGAGKPDRAEAAAWKVGLYNTIFLGSIGLIFLLFAPFIISFFTRDPDVARYGVSCLRIVSAGFLFYGYAMVVDRRLQRRRRHAHADADCPRLPVVLGDPTRLGARRPLRLRTDGRVHCRDRRLFDDVTGERVAVFERNLEDRSEGPSKAAP